VSLTPTTVWAGRFASVLLSAGVGAFVHRASQNGSPVARGLAAHGARLDHDLRFVRARLGGRALVRLQLAGVAAVIGVAIGCASAAPLVATVPVLVGPGLAARRSRLMRVQALEEQLDVWVLSLANALSATASLGAAIAASARVVPSPMRDEVETVLRETRLGAPLDAALAAMGTRIGSRVVSGALLTLRIARSAGGNARATLELAASTLREMARLEGVVRAKTAEGKAQALVVSVIPAPLVLAIRALSPEFFAPLGRSPAGSLVVLLAVALWGAAIALAAKICAVDV
jgi:tight adherence protein B